MTKRKHNSKRGWRWWHIRSSYIKKNPMCAMCLVDGVYAVATEVDHIIRLHDGGTHDKKNLQSLCHDCHAKKTAAEARAHKPEVGLDGY